MSRSPLLILLGTTLAIPVKLSSHLLPPGWKLFRLGGIFLLCALGGLALVDNWLPYALLSHHNRRVNLSLRPSEEQILVTAADGTITQGWLIPAPPTPLELLPRGQARLTPSEREALAQLGPPPITLILLHGLGANRQDYLNFGQTLQQAAASQGIPLTIALMDLRSHGESHGDYFTYGYHEVQDITALLNELEEQNLAHTMASPMQYAILGVSVGGAVATAATAQDDRLAALITLGTFADLKVTAQRQTQILPDIWRDRVLRRAEAIAQFNIAEAAPSHSMAQVQVPVLIAHGRQDGYIPFSNAEQLYAVAQQPKQLYPIADADHADMVTTGGEALQQEILSFLQTALKQQ